TTVMFENLTDGAHKFEVAAVDEADNVDASPAVRNFSVRTTPPQLSNIAATPRDFTATITWTTDEAATSQVDYGATDQYGSSTTLDQSNVTSHKVVLNGLTPLTAYHFRVRSKDTCQESQSPDQTF